MGVFGELAHAGLCAPLGGSDGAGVACGMKSELELSGSHRLASGSLLVKEIECFGHAGCVYVQD